MREGVGVSGITVFPRILRPRSEHGSPRNPSKLQYTTRVGVSRGTISVDGIFAEPPSNPASDWAPAIVPYRAVAAGYHEGERTSTGHYWALVRGTEPGHGAHPGYRRCNDAVCTSGGDLDRERRGLKWDDPEASRRVIIVALERVDTQRVRKSLSERDNVLAPSVQ